MLHKGMAVIVRNKEEAKVFDEAVYKKGYRYRGGQVFKCQDWYPTRYSINTEASHNCMSKCDDLDYELNRGIEKVVEASDLFRNQLISMKRKMP